MAHSPTCLSCLTGADHTGKFSGKGKLSWWKVYAKASKITHDAFVSLGSETQSSATELVLEPFVCHVYLPGTTITSVSSLRWYLFSRKQAEGQNDPHQELH